MNDKGLLARCVIINDSGRTKRNKKMTFHFAKQDLILKLSLKIILM